MTTKTSDLSNNVLMFRHEFWGAWMVKTKHEMKWILLSDLSTIYKQKTKGKARYNDNILIILCKPEKLYTSETKKPHVEQCLDLNEFDHCISNHIIYPYLLHNNLLCMAITLIKLWIKMILVKWYPGGTAIYGQHRYVPLWRVWFSSSSL